MSDSIVLVISSPLQLVVGQIRDTLQLPEASKSVSPRTRIPSTSCVSLLKIGEPEFPP